MEGHFFPRPARRQTAGLALGSCSRQDLPLGSGMVVFLLDYRGLAGEENQGGGVVVFLSLKRAQKRHCSLLHPAWRGWIPVMRFGKAIRTACPQNTAAGILGLLCSFLWCRQSPVRRKVYIVDHKPTFSLWFQEGFTEVHWVRIWPL